MFKLTGSIRNIDSSDSEDGDSPRQKASQSSPVPTIILPGCLKVPKSSSCALIKRNPVLKKALWLLVFTCVFIVVCLVSAPMLKRKFVAPKAYSEPSVWWKPASTTEEHEHWELSGGHYIFSKASWEGVQATQQTPMEHPTSVVLVSNSQSDSCYDFAKCASVVRSTQEQHMSHDNLPDIAFNFLIGGDGNVYEGRGWDIEGAHHLFGVCFLGDYDFGKKELMQGQIEAAQQLFQYGVKLGKLSKDYVIVAPNQVVGASYPGDNVLKVISKFPRWDPSFVVQ